MKIAIRVLSALLMTFFLSSFPVVALADWKPPLDPNPNEILNEARTDAREKRYEDALAKHVWFHHNALTYDRALYGVRLSFALSYWHSLSLEYPPALEKLCSIRDEAEGKVKAGIDAYQSFNDFEAINKELKENNRTVLLFRWLDANKPAQAEAVFVLAQPALVYAKEYSLYGKYVDPGAEYERLLRNFRETKLISEQPEFGESLMEFAEHSFSNGVSTLVAVLVVNGRNDEALRIVSSARPEWDDPAFHAALGEALRGQVPEPWP